MQNAPMDEHQLEPILDEVESGGRSGFSNALVLARAFKVLAVVATVFGLALAVVATRRFSGMTSMSWLDRASIAGGTLLSTMLTASALAFFGFILEIGVGCWDRLGGAPSSSRPAAPDPK